MVFDALRRPPRLNHKRHKGRESVGAVTSGSLGVDGLTNTFLALYSQCTAFYDWVLFFYFHRRKENVEEKQKGDDGDDIKENEEKLKQDGEKKAQNEDDEAEQKDSVTTEQDNGKDNKEKDSVKGLALNTLGTRFPMRGGEGGFLFTIR